MQVAFLLGHLSWAIMSRVRRPARPARRCCRVRDCRIPERCVLGHCITHLRLPRPRSTLSGPSPRRRRGCARCYSTLRARGDVV